MENVIIMSGIGGQGIVVGSNLLGVAATVAGKYCQHVAEYGGEMRGGRCQCTLTVSDNPVMRPPMDGYIGDPECTAAIIMHPNPMGGHGKIENPFHKLAATINPGGLALVNSSLVEVDEATARKDIEWVLVPATDMAIEIGNAMVATMIAIAAFAEETGAVSVDSIKAALAQIIPPYRHKLLEIDNKGLDAGVEYIRSGKARRFRSQAPYVFAKTAV